MPENLNYGIFPLKNEAAENDSHRPGTHLLEYFEVAVTVDTNLGAAEVPTTLDNVIGVISAGYMGTFDTGDCMHGLSTDGVITTGAVTVRVTTVSIANGSLTIRGYLIGTKKDTTVLLSAPTD